MTHQPSTERGPVDGGPADSWLEPAGEREPALAPWWLPVGPGTVVDETDRPDLQDVWVDLWPAPKEPWRRRALGALVPTVVLVLATTLLVTLAAYAYRPAEPRDRTYLPTDGAYAQVSLDGQPGGQLEQSVGTGAGVVTLGVIGAAAAKTDLTEWAVDHDLWVADVITATGRLRVVLVVDRTSVGLLGVLTDTDVAAFLPALPVSRGAEGSQRTGHVAGSVTLTNGQNVPYAADTTVAGDGDCVDWSAAITTTAVGVAPLELSLRACHDTGLQRFGFHRTGQSPVDLAVTGTAAPTGRFDGSITTTPVRQSDVAGWTPTRLAFRSRDASGTHSLYPVVSRQPLVVGTDRFVLIGNDNSLTLFAVEQAATSVWTAHPGGRVTHLISAGELIIAATDQRRLIAYDQTGRRVWQRDLPDLVGDLTQIGDRLVVSVFTGVVLSIDLRSGTEQWRQELDSVKSSPGIAASTQIVAVAEGDSTVHALDLTTGADQGDTTGASIGGLAADGRSMIILRSDRLLRVDTTPGGGTTLDLDTRTGIAAVLFVVDQLAVVSGTSLVVIDLSTGTVVARGPAASSGLATTPGAVVVPRVDGVTVITPSAPQGTTFPTELSAATPDAGIGPWGAVVVDGDDVVVIR